MKTKVLIIGGGPAGLITAIELGRRDVPCIVLEEDTGPPEFPKANATTSRTMEHYRRLGFATDVRALGLPLDYPQDVTHFTRIAHHELARLPGRTRAEAASVREGAHSRWPTPEPLHRTQQMYIEAVMRRQVARYPSIDLRLGFRATKVSQTDVQVHIEAIDTGTNAEQAFYADFVVGCEGARSLVRESMGVKYEGVADEEREFLGGRMLATYFRAPAFYELVRAPRSWQYWANNRERRAVYSAIDGQGLFVTQFQLPRGTKGSLDYAHNALRQSMGCEFPHDIIAIEEWHAGFTLVAERFRAGRAFIAGDAAHLFTPTGGQGYNTSVDDAANLGWKLAAVCRGWASASLLDSYEAERQPIARRNTSFARAMADSIGRMTLPPELEEDSPAGVAAREALGKQLYHHTWSEFDIPGIHFGMFYGTSPVIIGDGTPPPEGRWDEYLPHATPGARAPHVWLDDETALFDCFGQEFTLLCMGSADPSAAAHVKDRAAARGMPIEVCSIDNAEARDLYARDFVLIRPDQHIAWRGNRVPDDLDAWIKTLTGAS